MFLILLFMRPAARVHAWCQRWLPSNRIVRHLHTRRGLRWGLPATLLGTIYFIVGIACLGAVHLGHTEWFYLGMAICWWNAVKLTGHGLYATIALLIVRARENLAVRRAIHDQHPQARWDDMSSREWTRRDRIRITRDVRRDLIAR